MRGRGTMCRSLIVVLIVRLFIGVHSQQIHAQERGTIAERARRFESYIEDAAQKYGVNPRLLWVIAYLETRFDPDQKSRKGASGLMQFMPLTASRYGLENPSDPIAAIDAAARYVRDLAIRFGNRADLVLAAYNSGEATVEAYLLGRTIKAGSRTINPKRLVTGGIPPYRETREYVSRGLQLLRNYREENLRVMPTASKQARIEYKRERSQPSGLVRQSIRTGINTGMIEEEEEKTQRFKVKLSIHFGNQH